MNLAELRFPPILNTSEHNVIADFFEPALRAAVRYDRGVGYFSSGWFRAVASGMGAFAKNGGRARWITSPILSKDDWEALTVGDQGRSDPILYAALKRNIESLAQTLQEDTLAALAWMVADGIITIRLALPHHKLEGGEFHTKFGIFTDLNGNMVSFEGSNNETVRGSTLNFERFKVFCSWKPEFTELVQSDKDLFERLWQNQDENVQVFDLPDAARKQILKLRSAERPYPKPSWIQSDRLISETGAVFEPPRPRVPAAIQLRDYQESAISAWFANDCRGLLEMATGTGKTITALAASAKLFDQGERLAVVIAVPYQHLVDQWREEAAAFGYVPILAYQSKSSWLDPLNHEILDFNGGYKDFVSVITTHTTFSSPDFQATLARLDGPALLIADEAHHLGAEVRRRSFPEQIPYRLALSATPDRWFDDVGTAALRTYFSETIFAFGLEDAIGVSLTPYYYHPHLVPLTDDEVEEYENLSAKIARMMGREDDEGQDALKMLLIRRSNLLNRAVNKLTILSELVDDNSPVEHTLFYCAPGQIDDVVELLGGEKGLWINRFTAEEDAATRQELLVAFATGEIQALVAMKCLDEGVDIPSTRTAYFLASSSNPREFIQRRGRILRKAPGKEYFVIHDLIAVPPNPVNTDSPTFGAERSIMRRELQRFREFAGVAMNKHQAMIQ